MYVCVKRREVGITMISHAQPANLVAAGMAVLVHVSKRCGNNTMKLSTANKAHGTAVLVEAFMLVNKERKGGGSAARPSG